MVYANRNKVNLMIWETDPSMRNKNNVIKVNAEKKITLTEGDVITGSGDSLGGSRYTVIKVLDTRQSSLKGYNYVTLETKWSRN